MKKDAFYFPHFSNARHDRKLKRAMKELGCEAYGIYFMLLEVLREQQDLRYPMGDIDLLEDEFKTSMAKIQAVIKGYDLFQIDEDNKFFSMKFVFYLQPYFDKSERARTAANIRWENVKLIENAKNANAEQMQCNGNASKVKESKVKESKVNKKVPKKKSFELPSWFDNDLKLLFEDHLKIRTKIKAQNTDIAIKSLLTTLTKLSNSNIDHAKKLIENAIVGSWKSYFQLKDEEIKSLPTKKQEVEILPLTPEQLKHKKELEEQLKKGKEKYGRDRIHR